MSEAALTNDEMKKKLKALEHFHKKVTLLGLLPHAALSCPPFPAARVKVQLFFTTLKELPRFLLCYTFHDFHLTL